MGHSAHGALWVLALVLLQGCAALQGAPKLCLEHSTAERADDQPTRTLVQKSCVGPNP